MKEIDTYLHAHRPPEPDEGQFLINLNARLDAVEGLKETVQQDRREGRTLLLVAGVTGFAAGCLAAAVLLLHPAPPKELLAHALEALDKGKDLIFVTVAALALTLGTLSVRRKWL